VASVNEGISHVLDVPSERLARLVREGRLCATSSFDEIAEMDVMFICVPTPHDAAKAPDLRYV
jgi:UDP-N-acetyl-D-mannosaminuronate dehydrogenase